MKTQLKQKILSCAVVVLILAVCAAAGMKIQSSSIEFRQREVVNILHYYSENILLQMQGSLNEASALAQMAPVVENRGDGWFEKAAESLLQREEIRYICLIEGDTVTAALPKAQFGGLVGRNLKDFSYIYTLTKVVKELVVEGPVVLDFDPEEREVFLFLQPFVEDNAYLGEVGVALDRDYVLNQLGLTYLSERGYDYELWRVNPQNGDKEVVAASRQGVDFSHAAKTDFNLPTQWNLSIQPVDGWISTSQSIRNFFACGVAAILLILLAFSLRKTFRQGKILKQQSFRDAQSGMYNYKGFVDQLNHWLPGNGESVQLFYFIMEGYNRISQQIGPDEEEAFLRDIPRRLKEYIQSPYIAGHLGGGNFVIAVREDMDEGQRESFAKGLALEFLLKIQINGRKSFTTTRYQSAQCKLGSGGAEEEVKAIVHAYFDRMWVESPVRALTEKCRRLIDGESDVSFDEYADLDMMELSKTFNQYRKKVEQLAYSDPVFNVGNRSKFVRDVNTLISYDKRRQFTIFCVDICSFSQFNELFSTEIADQIISQVLHRLERPFGAYRYRINGDVFLGISLSDELAEPFAQRLQNLCSTPIVVDDVPYTIQVRVAACRYPEHGDSPNVLLDRIQSAMRFSKAQDRKMIVYNGELTRLIRTEADILHQLKSAIQRRTMEVWYQPMMNLKTGRFIAVEALGRLPDGKGGYFPADQVISLAEREGMMEQLGDYVLECACRLMCDRGEELGLSHMGVNVSVQQLLVGNSADHLLNIIRTSGAKPEQVTLEITEGILIRSIEKTAATLEQLRRENLRIALDDFGEGYSSLNYLSNLPADVIKIASSLTGQICSNPKQYALLRAIVEMAKINSMTVVVEGVETEEVQQMIAASGVEYIQGYYFARPMSEEALIDFLRKSNA